MPAPRPAHSVHAFKCVIPSVPAQEGLPTDLLFALRSGHLQMGAPPPGGNPLSLACPIRSPSVCVSPLSTTKFVLTRHYPLWYPTLVQNHASPTRDSPKIQTVKSFFWRLPCPPIAPTTVPLCVRSPLPTAATAALLALRIRTSARSTPARMRKPSLAKKPARTSPITFPASTCPPPISAPL